MATIKSTEEKAKAYDEAIERAKDYKNDTIHRPLKVGENIMDYIFPELAESDSERIRKALFEMVHDTTGDELWVDYNVHKEDALAWLEKQGKQKPINDTDEDIVEAIKDTSILDLVEPKFKVGDWISGYYTNYKVLSVNNKGYLVEDVDGNRINILFENEKFHSLWTIQDAKDGDVLATSAGAFIYNGNNDGGSCPGSYCGINTLGGFETGVEHHWTGKKVYPATKEQRDFLFRKMRKAGYVWDAEKLELRKIEQKPQRTVSAEAKEEMYSKPAEWSDDDESNCEDILNHLERARKYFRKDDGITFDEKWFNANIEWLKSIKDRVQPKQEWNEEDEKNFQMLQKIICDSDMTANLANKLSDWLKSLRPQNRWKPSEEQMEAINTAINVLGKGTLNGRQLIELQEQLKKLKGE